MKTALYCVRLITQRWKVAVTATTPPAVPQRVWCLSDPGLVSAMHSPSFLHHNLSTKLCRLFLSTSGYYGTLLSWHMLCSLMIFLYTSILVLSAVPFLSANNWAASGAQAAWFCGCHPNVTANIAKMSPWRNSNILCRCQRQWMRSSLRQMWSKLLRWSALLGI